MTTFPIYIPTRGRADCCLTANLLIADGIEPILVVEPVDVDAYAKQFGEKRLLVLPESSRGIAYVRNWIKRHSEAKGEERHWQVDDNIRSFQTLHPTGKKTKEPVGGLLRIVEANVTRFSNIAAAGLSHSGFAFGEQYGKQPVQINRQVYSCVLFANHNDVYWREDIVEDTDYSMQCLTAGYVTLLFKTLLIEKMTTMTMKGGNTDKVYAGDGRLRRSLGLQKAWPGCFEITEQYGRVKVKPSRVWSKFTQKPIPV